MTKHVPLQGHSHKVSSDIILVLGALPTLSQKGDMVSAEEKERRGQQWSPESSGSLKPSCFHVVHGTQGEQVSRTC